MQSPSLSPPPFIRSGDVVQAHSLSGMADSLSSKLYGSLPGGEETALPALPQNNFPSPLIGVALQERGLEGRFGFTVLGIVSWGLCLEEARAAVREVSESGREDSVLGGSFPE